MNFVEEYIGFWIIDEVITGEYEFHPEDLRPATDYLVVVFGYDMAATTPVTKYAFRTLD